MIEILPIKLLTEEDALIYGSLSVSLGKLSRAGLPVAEGIVITPPNLKLKTLLEHFNFHTKEVFEESLTLVKKEINSIPVPEVLIKETGKHKEFLLSGEKIKGVKALWLTLLWAWLSQIKDRLWEQGFYPGVTGSLTPKIVTFVKKMEFYGNAYFDPFQKDVEIHVKVGNLHPKNLKKIVEIVEDANKKLFIPHEYEWILDGGIKLVGLKPFTPSIVPPTIPIVLGSKVGPYEAKRSAVKEFVEVSNSLTYEKDVDGIYIASEKIFDLDKPVDSFEELISRLIESANFLPDSPVLFKLADQKSEGKGNVRGTLRLLHQKSLLDPLIKALDFVRHKKGLTNVHIVVPFVRRVEELLQIKRELAIKKLMRKASLQLFLEIAVPENIINLENYLAAGVDGVILNLDELVAHLNGFDPSLEYLAFYKQEVEGLIKFLEQGIKLLHKSKVLFIAYGTLSLNSKVLEFLVEKGVYGIVVEKYEAHSFKDLLNQTEKRMILRRSS